MEDTPERRETKDTPERRQGEHMKLDNKILDIDLAHFDGGEGGGAPAGGTEGAAAPSTGAGASATGVTGNPDPAPAADAEARKAEYAKFKEQYKDLYGEDVKGHVESRLKKYKPLEQQVSAMNTDVAELLELTGTKTLAEAKEKIRQQREKQIDDEAYENGKDPAEYRRDLEVRRKAEAYDVQQQREAFVRKMTETWQAQAAELAKSYPGFNLQAVAADPTIVDLMKSGHSVKAAYETVNAAQILAAVPEYEGFDFSAWAPSSAFTSLLENGFEIRNAFEATNLDWTKQAAAKMAEKRTIDTIKGGSRPKEMGASAPTGGARNKGITEMTPAESKKAMDDILAGRAKPSDFGM